MNWAYQMLRNTPDVQQWVAAPWMVKNEYYDPLFRFFIRDFQQKIGIFSSHESTLDWLSTNLIRLEKRWPLYKHWLIQQIKNDPPDVLHAHFAPVGCHYLDVAKALDIPLIVSFYGFDFQRLPFEQPTYKARYQQLFLQASAITTTGPFTPKLLVAQGCPAEKIRPVPLSIALDQFTCHKREKLPGNLRLVQIATFTEKKGHLNTLEALKRALPKCPNLHLTFAGEYQDKALVRKIANFIKSNNLTGSVTWLNHLPHEDLPNFLNQFEVFIHPSTSTARLDSEGSPVVILEAQANGLPIIATTHADIPAEVLHGITGLLSPENDAVDLARSIERFYFMENDEYQQFSVAARQHVEQNFDIRDMGKKLLSLYSEVCKR